jgi:hypothetical protein
MREAELREDPPLDADAPLVHMGAGDVRLAAESAIRNYSIYRGIQGAPGLLTVSVYGAIRGISVEQIVAEMPHGQYGTASHRKVANAGFDVIPTTIHGTPIPEWLMALHHDIVLPLDLDLAPEVLADPDEEATEHTCAALAEPLARLMTLFEPRERK